MNKKTLAVLMLVVGFVLVGVAVMYWITPAGSLMPWVPGYEAGSSTIHVKHGIGAFVLGFGAFAFAWFQTGKKSA